MERQGIKTKTKTWWGAKEIGTPSVQEELIDIQHAQIKTLGT